MKKLFLVALLFITGCQLPQVEVPVQKLMDSTVKVETDYGSGSGVVLNDNYIVTNAHVVDSAKEVKVLYKNKYSYLVKVVKLDTKLDLAILYVENVPKYQYQITSLCLVSPGVFDPVVAVGAGLGLPVYPTKGYVSNPWVYVDALAGEMIFPIFIQHTAPIAPGNSGGPLFFNDCVAGINSRGAAQIGLAIPASIIELFLEDIIYGR